ncbi:IS3 family transposase [Ligilactobacillus ruminis]|uniref:IS3 family transposase n=1 Tax=Ligilactobacillus ruminis TaxID=1623 RepID=UPI003A7F3BC0
MQRKKKETQPNQEINDNLEELETSVQGAIDYFNRKRAYASKNGLTAEQFRNQAVSC